MCNVSSKIFFLDSKSLFPALELSGLLTKVKNNSSNLFHEDIQDLIDKGIVEETIGGLQFVQDYLASSVSKAAGLILGGSKNGWEYWKDSDGMIINDSLRKKK